MGYFRWIKPDIFGPFEPETNTPEDSSGLVKSSKDRAHGRLHQGDPQTLTGTGPRPARWGLMADDTPRERGKTKLSLD
ncbi:hypothetical protein CHARACLAT_031004 [Characodon lateralis]|uniref:Uncharacterized protein n=1 Tax=Characodon lateralis TaxID=208331 RepID=A0ABU7EEB6_9TELE|nr:hypothetical protein [Characodon lateralis]